MIFGTVGFHFQGFERLVKRLDDLAPTLDERVVIQIGHTEYTPRNAEYFRFAADDATIDRLVRDSRVVVAHAGTGTILRCLELGRPVIVMPRRAGFGEHVDDHQWEIAEALAERRLILAVKSPEELTTELLLGDRPNPQCSTSTAIGTYVASWLASLAKRYEGTT